MIKYTDDMASVREDMLDGFFAGWPRHPSPAQHLAVLRGRAGWTSAMIRHRDAQAG
jgi:hypothetical protein